MEDFFKKVQLLLREFWGLADLSPGSEGEGVLVERAAVRAAGGGGQTGECVLGRPGRQGGVHLQLI